MSTEVVPNEVKQESRGPGSPSSDPTTMSGIPIKRVYGPDDIGGIEFLDDIGQPGQFPFTRGMHPNMYRKRVWTMRQFAGMGSAAQTNERFIYLLDHGQTGLSTAFDLPTLMGRDSDDPLALGEVGKCGVAIASLDDMKVLFDGINLGDVSTSMTINAPAAILLAFYICVGKQQGVPLDRHTAGFGIDRVQVQAMAARDQAVCHVQVAAQLVGGARFARIVARGGDTPAQLGVGGLETAHVIALPAVQAERDRGECRHRRLGVHAERGVPFLCQRVGVGDLFVRRLMSHGFTSVCASMC